MFRGLYFLLNSRKAGNSASRKQRPQTKRAISVQYALILPSVSTRDDDGRSVELSTYLYRISTEDRAAIKLTCANESKKTTIPIGKMLRVQQAVMADVLHAHIHPPCMAANKKRSPDRIDKILE